jgi:hypothetical protein
LDGGGNTIGIYAADPKAIVSNSIIYDCTNGIENSKAAGATHGVSKNNIFWLNDADRVNWPADDSDIAADPLFVNPGANDYRVQAGSPALAAGIDAGQVVNGESFIDIGAHQREATNTVYHSAMQGGLTV